MDVSKMTNPPWDITADKNWIYAVNSPSNGGDIICLEPDMEDSKNRFPHNAKAICLAVNSTWGADINPEGVKGLLDALENILLDAEPLKGGELVAIPSVSIKLIKAAIKKAKIL